MESKKWLRYWRTSLADIDRRHLKLDKENTRWLGALDAPSLRDYHAALMAAPDAPAEAGPLLVMVAPFSLRPAVGDNRRKASEGKVLHPFWIPARLTEAGTLLPPTEDQPLIPWLVREVLEPADRNYPVLSNVEVLDAELALWNWNFATATWPSYWANAEAFYGRVCATRGWPANQAQLGKWVTKRDFTITQPPASGFSAGVINLYGYLEKLPVLPPLLTTVLHGQPPGVPLHATDSAVLLAKGHYGQMSDKFPLSPSQRFTLQALLMTAPGDVFPVNGPPGTGKTTLLQSVVANLVVEKALLGAEAPRVLASSTNNQAITNILDSFGREARVDRWVPGLASLGLYLTNKEPAKAEQRGYQVHSSTDKKFAGFFKAKEDKAGKYLKEAQADLVRQGAAFFGRALPTPAALRDELHRALGQQVARIDAWLTLLPHLRDEDGRPWDAVALRRDLQTTQAQAAALETYQVELARLQASESSFDHFLAPFLASVRRKMQARYLLLVREYCPYRDDVTKYDPEHLKAEGVRQLVRMQQVERRIQAVLTHLATFKQLAVHLRHDYAHHAGATEWLAALNAADPASVHNALDVTHRHSAFGLALHYWEARYVVALHEKVQHEKVHLARQPRQGKVVESPPAQYARWAMLTPCFISTFQSGPGFAKVKGADDEVGYALELFDLLLVDEAGQVSPEVGVAAFALARKAVVVGDTRQIEPVWGLEGSLDAQNQRRQGLDPSRREQQPYWVSKGSLMQLAQLATPFRLANYAQERGLLLSQHRRCKPEIIRYCDEFVYDGQLERLGNPKQYAALGLPPLGYLHIHGECTSEGGSKQNLQEAEAIARWLGLHQSALLAAARPPGLAPEAAGPLLKDIVGIVTPFSSQRNAINRALATEGLGGEGLTVGTVHALQGAERAIVLFSSVYDTRHQGSYFFDKGYNLLNVAVSRAKEAFIVVGNRCLFNPTHPSPSGDLAKLLFEEPAADDQPRHELDNSFFYGDESRRHLPVPRAYLPAVAQGKVRRLSQLKDHRNALAWAINTAEQHLVIVSPFISVRAVQADGLADLIKAAKTRRPALSITVYTDAHLDSPNGQLHAYSQAGREALARAGADVKIAAQIHNKTVCFDGKTLLEGSFNWLSASRSEATARHEVTWLFTGEAWAGCIEELVQEMESRVVSGE